MNTRMARWGRTLAPAILALPLLAACGGGHSSGAASPSGGAPPGGWPKPVNGKLTAAMCGLLTSADYLNYGHMRLKAETARRAEDLGPNVVVCGYTGGDDFELNLQPGTVAAHLIYKGDLRQHKKRQRAGAPAPAANVVPGADESWYDDGEHQIEFRRGALVASLTLGFLDDGSQQANPKTILSGLARLVMRRTNAGASGPGTFRTVRYRVSGHGVAELISYTDPNTLTVTQKKKVHLPWSKDIPYGERGAAQMDVSLSALAYTRSFEPAITCAVRTEHRPPITKTDTGSVDCDGSLSPGNG